ncbi:FtsL-like putative cell division protein [Dysgonomonas sp. 25]|uniref:FtsL-like putative cell division protein n=1 Tax=Dysgonomonas sp. 25 TaxID=2302933 RepID=UPI0013D3D234|nr:FtsL-like putative cell division protein [Dysgonomonas sp. 25]NDV68700.1 hypothetical protein [Dysgonomonas sp. 25]
MKAKEVKKKFMHIVGGSVLAEDFVTKNIRFIIVIFVILVFYISNRYSCIEKQSKIESLQRELKDAKYESLTISAKLISVSRETRVNELIKKNELELERTKEPVYKIKK